jgi:para-nitrobenzyl esterase
VAQSGIGHRLVEPEDAATVTRELAKRLGVPPTREGIATVPVDRLYAAQYALTQEIPQAPARWGQIGVTMMPFGPVADDDTLPQDPLDAIRSGVGSDVEVMLGNNVDEHRFFLVPPGLIDSLGDYLVDAALRVYGATPSRIRAAYGDRVSTPGDLFAAAATDFFFRLPDIRLAEARSKAAGDTWMYEFAWPSPQFDGRLGACHYLEVPFVFDTTTAPSAGIVTGSDPPKALADDMHRRWVDFAASGDPGWPAYTKNRRAVMTFDVESGVVEDPREAERAAWGDQG